ncbi:hypothetical protein NM688_g2816 [Phlebia brevispora]|uniref:Uncharacterized protein n=1 Tax=Phlebia brevispora TaxID=194682 RepID=A0ACC1T7L7_9APHY|nr:hypothetical protein NM688_g2816 [Phlebia brevispora]
MTLVIAALFSALRVFALLDRAYLAAGCVLVLGLVQVGIALYESKQATYTYVDDPILGSLCFASSPLSNAMIFYRKDSRCIRKKKQLTLLKVAISGTLATIASDVIAIATTWLKTYRHVRQANSVGINAGFGTILWQYGTLYFVVLSVVDALPFVVFLTPSDTGFTSAIDVFVTILPNIVISRFLINLREVNSPSSSSIPRFSNFSAPNFRVPSLPEIIGNLGETLVYGDKAVSDVERGVNAEPYEKVSNQLCNCNDGHNAGISTATLIEQSSTIEQVSRDGPDGIAQL